MNKEWSDKNKKMQTLIGKDVTFAEGMDVLFELRNKEPLNPGDGVSGPLIGGLICEDLKK